MDTKYLERGSVNFSVTTLVKSTTGRSFRCLLHVVVCICCVKVRAQDGKEDYLPILTFIMQSADETISRLLQRFIKITRFQNLQSTVSELDDYTVCAVTSNPHWRSHGSGMGEGGARLWSQPE